MSLPEEPLMDGGEPRGARLRAPFRIAAATAPPAIRTRPEPLPDPLAPAAVRSPPLPSTPAARPHRTWQQVVGGLILAAVCVAAAIWYIPQVVQTDRRLLTGSVVTDGIATLNFTSAGQIAQVAVHQGQQVRKGQLLATEYAPAINSVIAADVTAVRSAQARLASMSSPGPHRTAASASELAAARAQLRLDQAQLTTDRTRAGATRIVAPAPGTVVAANGRPGEAVTTQGIRDYVNIGARTPVDQTPAFSLLPEAPQTQRRGAQTSSALPVVALRTSSAWQVATLVAPESVSRLHLGERVTISVPAEHITGVAGDISQVLSTPVATSQGDEYQALVSVTGHVAVAPLSGMAADIALDAPPARSRATAAPRRR